MEILPSEILEYVFHPLSKQEDIQKCYDTNSKWRHIVEKMFSNKKLGFSFSTLEEVQKCFKMIGNQHVNNSKILVIGGFSKGDRNPPLEIIDLIDTTSKPIIVIDTNGSRKGAIGGILQNKPVICGGYDTDIKTIPNYSIIGMSNNDFKMMSPRDFSASIALNESKIWVTGGYSIHFGKSNRYITSTTEIISLDQPPVAGPNFPFTVREHSMVLVNPTTIYLIGGFQNGELSNKTWIIDQSNNFQIRLGPPLNIARLAHSCSKMKIEGKNFLVAAGGKCKMSEELLDSVELLDTTCPDHGWKMGPKLPFAMLGSTMISSPTEKSVVMIGGYEIGGSRRCDLLELSGDSIETLEWKILQQKLQYPRHHHVSVSISNDIAASLTRNCISISQQN